MKVGESVPVTIAGQVVAQAEVKELGDGTATLIVPATRVVMGTRTELTSETAQRAGGVELLTDSVVRPEAPLDPAQNVDTPGQVTNLPDATAATPAPVATPVEQPAPAAEPAAQPVEAPTPVQPVQPEA